MTAPQTDSIVRDVEHRSFPSNEIVVGRHWRIDGERVHKIICDEFMSLERCEEIERALDVLRGERSYCADDFYSNPIEVVGE